jgi:hypothetical protein
MLLSPCARCRAGYFRKYIYRWNQIVLKLCICREPPGVGGIFHAKESLLIGTLLNQGKNYRLPCTEHANASNPETPPESEFFVENNLRKP